MEFLDGFAFPASGAVVFGARTSGGKTSVLINVAREYRRQGRRVAIISYEMNAQEIALALALSIYAEEHTTPIPGWTRADPGPGVRIANLDELECSLLPLPADASPQFFDLFSRVKSFVSAHDKPPPPLAHAYDKIADDIAEDKLAIFDAIGNIDRLADFIVGTDYSAYVVDYIQTIPPADGAPRDSYRSTQSVCDRIRELVNCDKKLLILGAQFNRTMGDETSREAFDPRVDQFREAADIEQIATLALGIGYEVDEEGHRRFFYKILKNRFAGRMNGSKLLSGGYFDFISPNVGAGGPWLGDGPKRQKA
jgi:hypothetical protein